MTRTFSSLSSGALCALAVATVFTLAGCSRSEPPAPATAQAPAPAPHAQDTVAAAAPQVGIDVAATVPTCGEAFGGGVFKPITSASDVGFSWSPVTQPAATQYAAQLVRQQPGSSAPAILISRAFKAGEEFRLMAGERVAGNSYRATVVAWGDAGPICKVDGINGLSPMAG